MNYFEKEAEKIVDDFNGKTFSNESLRSAYLYMKIVHALTEAVSDARRWTPDEVERSCKSELLWIERLKQERERAVIEYGEIQQESHRKMLVGAFAAGRGEGLEESAKIADEYGTEKEQGDEQSSNVHWVNSTGKQIAEDIRARKAKP